MIEHDYKELFVNDSIDKQFIIETDDGAIKITNTELHNEAFELTESIANDDSFVFGNVSAASLKFTVSNIFTELKNKWITVTTYLNRDTSNSFQIGRYKVYSDVPTADRKKREIKAYDALYDVLNADVTEWYNTILPSDNSSVTLKQFRDSFLSHFGIAQEEITLVNDTMEVKKTIRPEELSGKVVLNSICEINGCFGHISRNGKFRYIYLVPISEGLYPSETLYPSESLYPKEPNTNRIEASRYISATYEDYLVEKITKLQIRQEENDIGVIVGNGDNTYIIQDNFLVYGKTSSELEAIANKIFDKVSGIYYRPFNAKAKGNPCLEVGDSINLVTKYQGVLSYILQRTLTGIQSLRDEYTAEGTQYQPTQVNSTNKSIQQLQGRYNKLTRTVDETRLEMVDIEKGLRSEIRATAEQISLKVSADDVQSMISVALDEVVISSSQIRLEGYTTINGGFSIDLNGNAVLSGDIYTTYLSNDGLKVSVNNSSIDAAIYSTSNMTHGGIQWMSVINPEMPELQRGIVIGSPRKPIDYMYVSTINMYEPITSGNIGNYLAEIEARLSALEGGN